MRARAKTKLQMSCGTRSSPTNASRSNVCRGASSSLSFVKFVIRNKTRSKETVGFCSLVQLHIHDHELIRRQRLLENRLQFFFLGHGEAFGAVELGEFG